VQLVTISRNGKLYDVAMWDGDTLPWATLQDYLKGVAIPGDTVVSIYLGDDDAGSDDASDDRPHQDSPSR
jgi:hypothetical protein